MKVCRYPISDHRALPKASSCIFSLETAQPPEQSGGFLLPRILACRTLFNRQVDDLREIRRPVDRLPFANPFTRA